MCTFVDDKINPSQFSSPNFLDQVFWTGLHNKKTLLDSREYQPLIQPPPPTVTHIPDLLGPMEFLSKLAKGLTLDEDGESTQPEKPNDAQRQISTDSFMIDPRKSSFSNFDRDQRNPVCNSKINPNTMFDELNPQTPAGQALKANKDVKYTRFDKLGNKVLKKRVKVKNFTKDIKKSKRRRR